MIPYRDTWTKVRCEALVRRADSGWSTEEVVYRDEPCGRLAKTVVVVGNRDVPACHVHAKVLRRGLAT